MSLLTTEALLVSSAGFGITQATPAQLAICRIIDGRPLGELRDHPHVAELVGGSEALDLLRSEHGELPTEVCLLASIRSAKTIVALAAGIRATQAVDVSGLTHGEVPRVSIVSLRLDTAAAAFRMLVGTVQASPILRRLLIGDPTADALQLRHPSGRPIEIACVAGSKAGAGLVARWSAGFIADEAPRMSGSADGAVINLDDARSAVLGRLLPGAQALYIGSAWAPHGPVYDMVSEHWRKPSGAIVVLRGTGPMLNPQWWTPARCAALEARDETAYRTDVLGEFADPEQGLLNPRAISQNTRESPLELTFEPGARYCAAVDPSEGGASQNGFTLVIVQYIPPPTASERGKFRVAFSQDFRGLPPESTWAEISACCRRFELKSAATDAYAASANLALARRYGLTLIVDKATPSSKLEDYTNFAVLVHSDGIEFAPDRAMRRDLIRIKRRATQNGSTIILPRTSDGRHCDFASALVAAVKHGATGGEFYTPEVMHALGIEQSPPEETELELYGLEACAPGENSNPDDLLNISRWNVHDRGFW